MTVQANGTDAKDIALHFIRVTVERATPSVISRTVVQAKSLLNSGYTKQEIIKAIDYLVDVKKVQMYSLGYVSACINEVLKAITSEESKEKAKIEKEKLAESIKNAASEVVGVSDDGESTERNRRKSAAFGIESRFGEKLDFDLFKEHRQDD
jgi:hypothetical protein